VALGAFLVIDLVLVVLLLTHRGGRDTSTTGSSTSPTGSTTSSPRSSTTSSPTATTPAPHGLTAGLLSVVDARNAWAGTKGDCAGGGATISRTADGGATWTPAPEQPFAVLTRVDASSPTAAFVVGAGAGSGSSCPLSLRSTTSGGSTWAAPTTVANAWALDLADPTRVHSTKGTTSTPCGKGDVTAFARSSDTTASVACADATSRTTTDAGASWAKGPSMTSVTGLGSVYAMSYAGSGSAARLAAAVATKDCAGVRILVAAAGKDFVPAACVAAPVAGTTPATATTTPASATTSSTTATATSSSSATPPAPSGPVALARQGNSAGTLWLLVGTALWHGSADLDTWSTSS